MSKGHDPLDIQAIEATREQDRLKAVRDRAAEEDDFRWLMSSKRGRRIVWRLLEQSGVFRSSFSPTAMLMAYSEGNRNYGLKVLQTLMDVCPELYPQMTKENTNGRNPDDGRRPTQ